MDSPPPRGGVVGAAFCLAPSRQAAKTSAQTRRTRRCRPLASERDAQTTSASRRSSETPRPLRGSAALRETDAAARPTGLSIDRSASPSAAEDLAQSRRAAERSRCLRRSPRHPQRASILGRFRGCAGEIASRGGGGAVDCLCGPQRSSSSVGSGCAASQRAMWG